jgi:hypothetical protein
MPDIKPTKAYTIEVPRATQQIAKMIADESGQSYHEFVLAAIQEKVEREKTKLEIFNT